MTGGIGRRGRRNERWPCASCRGATSSLGGRKWRESKSCWGAVESRASLRTPGAGGRAGHQPRDDLPARVAGSRRAPCAPSGEMEWQTVRRGQARVLTELAKREAGVLWRVIHRKNRMRETCTSGSAREPAGNRWLYSAPTPAASAADRAAWSDRRLRRGRIGRAPLCRFGPKRWR